MEGVLIRPNISGGIYYGKNRMFLNNDHRKYYDSSDKSRAKSRSYSSMSMVVRCGNVAEVAKDDKKKDKKMMKKQKMMIKKRSKLLKSLSMDITGLLLDPQKLQLQEASEVLISQLKELQNERKELKKKMKEEKAKLKVASSSSSSESSDSECEGEVLDMNCLNHQMPVLSPSSITIDGDDLQQQLPMIMQSEAAPLSAPAFEKYTMPKSEQDRDNSLLSLLEGKRAEENNIDNNDKKIEVCMGGKCKKSGAGALLEEFQKVVDATAPSVDVIGCKCMGKCRDGPNVRLVSPTTSSPCNDGLNDDDEHHHHHQQVASFASVADTSSVLTRRSMRRTQRSSHPLCIGVGLEDVGFLVSKLVGDRFPNQLVDV